MTLFQVFFSLRIYFWEPHGTGILVTLLSHVGLHQNTLKKIKYKIRQRAMCKKRHEFLPSWSLQSSMKTSAVKMGLFKDLFTCETLGLPRQLSGKEPAYNAGAAGNTVSISGLERFSGGGHGNPLRYSCLENPMDRGAWRAIVHRVTKSQTWLKWAHLHVRLWPSVTGEIQLTDISKKIEIHSAKQFGWCLGRSH